MLATHFLMWFVKFLHQWQTRVLDNHISQTLQFHQNFRGFFNPFSNQKLYYSLCNRIMKQPSLTFNIVIKQMDHW